MSFNLKSRFFKAPSTIDLNKNLRTELNMASKVPESLKRWFLVHFWIDYIFGLPLLFFPGFVLNIFGLGTSETIMARLVGAALLGIGGISLAAKEKSKENYESLLLMKIIWSISAIIGLSLSAILDFELKVIPILSIFVLFSIVWIYYYNSLRK